MSLSPTLTSIFISTMKSIRGEERERLSGDSRELVGVVGEWDLVEVNNFTPDLLRQNPSALKRCLRSQKMLKLSIKFTN